MSAISYIMHIIIVYLYTYLLVLLVGMFSGDSSCLQAQSQLCHNSFVFFFVGTTDLQNLTVTYDQERYITIRCEFARGSQARGCHITVKTLTDRELISVNVTRNRTEDTAVKEFDVSMLGRLNISKLVVVGFDLEADGTIGEVSSIPLINLVKSTDEPSGMNYSVTLFFFFFF